MKILLGAVALAGVLLPAHALAQAQCTRSKSCEESLGYCLEYRQRKELPRAQLPCERSAAVCRRTGVWRGKYMRGTPEVNECRIFTPRSAK
jgi:hypothetical protein